MDIQFSDVAVNEISADWLIVAVWQDEALAGAAETVDQSVGGRLSQLIESGDVSGKPNELLPLFSSGELKSSRILIVGLGKRDEVQLRELGAAFAAAMRHVSKKETSTIAVALPSSIDALSWSDVTSAVVVAARFGVEGPWSHKAEPDRHTPKKIVVVGPANAPSDEIQSSITSAIAEAQAVSDVRALVNAPPNDLYPETFAQRAAEMAAEAGVECTIFDEERITQENMGSLLGVAQGSARPPRFVVLEYNGGGKKKLGIVGKGVTFDSGGLSLKPSDSMLDMKCDMAGAATTLGAVCAIAKLKLPVNVVGILALVENMPSGTAFKLGDVLRARNGKTIEIHNTDAEGRLILADALSYAVDQNVDHLIDLATLTGACVVALGMGVVGVMSNNEEWSKSVCGAAERVGELVWPLPMFKIFDEMIKSKVADMKNTGGSRWGGAITAAKLLEQFVSDVPWVHLDIAGPAFAEDDSATRAAGGTGVMVRTLVETARAYGS